MDHPRLPLLSYVIPTILVTLAILYFKPNNKAGMWDVPTVALVTGARQGLGKATATALGSKMTGEGSLLILTSRNLDAIKSVKDEIAKTNHGLKVCLMKSQFEKPRFQEYVDQIAGCLKDAGMDSHRFIQSVIIHTAASLGDMSQLVTDWSDADKLQEMHNVNVIAMLLLNNAFQQVFKGAKSKFVINFTAGSAANPLTSYGLTGMAKASRQIALSVMALERPDIRVLHFNPGLTDTEALGVIKTKAHDVAQRDYVTNAYKEGSVASANSVASSLINTIEKNQFKSGAVVAFGQ